MIQNSPPKLPLPQVQPEGSSKKTHWDIGWAALIVGALVMCAVYLIAIDASFAASLKESSVAAFGHFFASLLMIPLGALIGTPVWFFVWLLKRPERVPFKPFVLLGIAVFLLFGSAGRQSVQDAIYKGESSPPVSDHAIDYEKISAIDLARNAKTFDQRLDNDFWIRDALGKTKGDLKIVGWEAKDYGDGTFLVYYSFVQDGASKAIFLDVNTKAGIVRSVSKDESLRKKYKEMMGE